jgi:integrase/recombinase XerD
LLLTFGPKTYAHRRLHALVATILDTGCRIDEVLSARVAAFDFDNLLLTIYGKGRKERRVPFSTELRKVLFRFGQFKERAGIECDLMFPAREGGRWEHRNALRSYYCLLKRLGLPRSGFHRLRHTFATQYLRNGGDVVRLSIILGHSEVSTTMKYLHLLTEDLQRPHQSLSILNRLR